MTRRSDQWRDPASGFTALAVLAFVAGRAGAWVPGASGLTLPLEVAASAFALLAILGFPVRPTTAGGRIRTAFDRLAVAIAALAVGWRLWLGPGAAEASAGVDRLLAGNAASGADVLVLVSLLLLASYLPPRHRRAALPALGAGLVVLVAADSAGASIALDPALARTSQLTFLWCVDWLLVGLAAHLAGSEPSASDREQPARGLPSLLQSAQPAIFPNLLLLGVGALAGQAWVVRAPSVVVEGNINILVALVAVVLLRQSVALLESSQLHRDVLRTNQRLTILSTTDPATGLPNERSLQRTMEMEVARSSRTGRPFAALVCEVDHPHRLLADPVGRLERDALLEEVGQVIRRQTRFTDVVGRWRGEQFLAILPETGRADAEVVAERIRAVFERHRFAGGTQRLGCSLGVSAFPAEACASDDLIFQAGLAASAAKELGRDRIGRADDAVRQLADATDDPMRAEVGLLGTVAALEAVIAARDPVTSAMLRKSHALALQLAVLVGLDAKQTRDLDHAAAIHDVGKVALPDSILGKAGELTDGEWERVREHAQLGAEIVARIPALRPLAPILRSHHEHWDGSGYPAGLAGRAIPLLARVIAVTDAYAAMTTDRPHQPARSSKSALAEIRDRAGRQFDPRIVRALERLLAGAGAPGSLPSSEAIDEPGDACLADDADGAVGEVDQGPTPEYERPGQRVAVGAGPA